MKIFGKQKTVRQLWANLVYCAGLLWSSTLTLFPKLVFGNSVGVRNNVVPRVDLFLKRRTFRQYGLALEDAAREAARELSLKGACIFRHVGDSICLHAVQKRLGPILSNAEHCIDSPNGNQRRVIDPVALIPELKELIPDTIVDAICTHYQCAFKIYSVQVWRNMGVRCTEADRDKMDLMSNTLHNDHWPVTSLRLFIVLSDKVTKETGAFRYHDKRSSRNLFRSFKYLDRFLMPRSHRNELYDPGKLNYFEGALGDACVVNTQECLHGSSVPAEGAIRDVVQYLIVPDSGAQARGPALFERLPPDPEIADFLKQAGRQRTEARVDGTKLAI